MKYLTLSVIVVSLLLLSGCGNPAIDVTRANELIRNDDGKQISIDVLINEFGKPNSITSAQMAKLEDLEKKLMRGNSTKTNYDNAKVWGNNKAFIVVFATEDGIIVGHRSIGGTAPRRSRPKRD